METVLPIIVKALFDAFGKAAVLAACDDECKIREHRAEVVARREAGEPVPPRPPEEL